MASCDKESLNPTPNLHESFHLHVRATQVPSLKWFSGCFLQTFSTFSKVSTFSVANYREAVRDSYNCREAVRDNFLFKKNIFKKINRKLYLDVTFGPPYISVNTVRAISYYTNKWIYRHNVRSSHPEFSVMQLFRTFREILVEESLC